MNHRSPIRWWREYFDGWWAAVGPFWLICALTAAGFIALFAANGR